MIPLNILSADRFEKLCADIGIEEAPRGTVLFSQGDAKNEFVYVLSGTVSLQAGGMEMETISGGSESAKFALAHQIPRKVSAIARDKVRYVRVDSDYVNQPNHRVGGVATYEVSDLPEESTGDWVTTLLKSPIFQRLPPANLQQILSKLEEVPVQAGQEIIHQDEPGDYYYIIKKGRCQLTRKPSRLAREVKLAELRTCDTFGEDALISEQPRNVTVTMTSKGALLRLNKTDFLKLVKDPVITMVDLAKARHMVSEGAHLLDVRSPDLYEEGHLPGASNIPFFRLRVDLGALGRDRPYVLVCETGRLSEAAAFLLIRNHFDALVLKGGMSGIGVQDLETGAAAAPPAAHEIAPSRPAFSEPVQPSAPGESRRLKDVESLSQENHRLLGELDSVKGALADLQRAGTEGREAERALNEQIALLKRETEEAGSRAAALEHELKQRADAQPGATELTEWRDRLAAEEAKREGLEGELAEARTAQHDYETERRALIAEKEALEQALRAQREIVIAQKSGGPSAHPDLEGLREQLAVLEREKLDASARRQELEAQVAELSAVVREFVERQQGGEDESEETLSLRAELETVREQATTDVMAMHAKLRSSEKEVSRLKGELDAAQQRLLSWEVERLGQVEGGQVGPGKTASAGWGAKALFALIGIVFGAALLSALAVGTGYGRELTRQLLTEFGVPQ